MQAKQRIVWNEADMLLIAQALWALKDEEMTVREKMTDVMMHLPQDKRRDLKGGNLDRTYKQCMRFAQSNVLKMISPEPEPTPVPVKPASLTGNLAKVLESIAREPLRVEPPKPVTMDNIQTVLSSHLAEVKLAILASEVKQAEMLDRLFQKMAGEWRGAEVTETIFAQDLKVMKTSIAGLEEVRVACLKKGELSMLTSLTKRKPRVLIFGAYPAEKQMLQERLPELQVEVASTLKGVSGSYALIVALTAALKTHDRDYFNKHYHGAWLATSGRCSRAIDAVRNHLMLA